MPPPLTVLARWHDAIHPYSQCLGGRPTPNGHKPHLVNWEVAPYPHMGLNSWVIYLPAPPEMPGLSLQGTTADAERTMTKPNHVCPTPCLHRALGQMQVSNGVEGGCANTFCMPGGSE